MVARHLELDVMQEKGDVGSHVAWGPSLQLPVVFAGLDSDDYRRIAAIYVVPKKVGTAVPLKKTLLTEKYEVSL